MDIGMASAWDEQLLANSFTKNRAGRLVFLPFGLKKPGYYIDSPSDEQKTKPFVRMYFLARLLAQLVGNLTAFFFAEGVAFADPHTPAVDKIKVFLVIYVITISLFELLPLWLISRLYRKSIPEICSAMAVAGVEEVSRLDRSLTPWRRRALLVLGGLTILIGVIMAVLVARR
jgi:hypothetical protein